MHVRRSFKDIDIRTLAEEKNQKKVLEYLNVRVMDELCDVLMFVLQRWWNRLDAIHNDTLIQAARDGNVEKLLQEFKVTLTLSV